MYVLAKNKTVEQYPYGQDLLRRDNPDTSFPFIMTDAELAEWNVYLVTPTAQPDYNQITQNCTEANPIYQNGWVQQWSVTSATPEEIAEREASARQQNKQQAESLLQATDWTENPSARNTAKTPHLVNGEAFDDYRVALRAIAVNPPVTVLEWPVKPDEVWS
jgi:hypothetical protein